MFSITVPGPLNPPVIISVNSTTAIIGWDEPEDPNGMIISYNIEYLALDFPERPYSDRRRAINEDLLKCFIHLGRTNETFLLRSSEIKQISLNNLCERLKNNYY